ncbi:MAG TPA: hypothetical protein VGG33_27605 [Polyangia bacterium]
MIDRNRRGVCSRPLALMLLVAASCAPAPMDAGSPDRSRMGGNGAGSGNAGSLGSSSGTGGSSGGSALGPAGSNGSAGSSGQGTVGGTGGSGSSAGSNTGSGTGSTGTSGGGSGTGGSTGTTSGGGTGSGSTTGSNGGTQPSGGNPGGGQQGGGDPSGGQQGGGDPGGGQQGGGDPSGGQPGGGTGTGTGGGQTGAMQCNSIGQVGSAFTPRASSGARSEQARGGMIEEGTYAVTSFSLNRVSDPSQLGFANVRMTGTVRFTASTMEQVLTTETGAGMPPVTRRSSDGYVASGNKLTFSMGCPAEPRREDVEYTATETEVRILATDSQTGIQSTLVMVKR